jgi:hypothetical protein
MACQDGVRLALSPAATTGRIRSADCGEGQATITAHRRPGIALIVGGIVLAAVGASVLASLVSGDRPQASDVLWGIGALIVVLVTFLDSPLKEVISRPEFRAFQASNPEVDVSTPLALLTGITTGGVSLGVAAAANATGFGVFMAAASALAPLHLSFAAMGTAMSTLGVLLNPFVFIPLAIGGGIVAALTLLKSGDAFLDEATLALHEKRYSDAYAACVHASQKKWFLRPSGDRIARWRSTLREEIRTRKDELTRLHELAADVARRPSRRCVQGALAGGGCGLVLGVVGLCLHAGSVWALGAAIAACALFGMERNLSTAVVRMITIPPALQSELSALEQVNAVAF